MLLQQLAIAPQKFPQQPVPIERHLLTTKMVMKIPKITDMMTVMEMKKATSLMQEATPVPKQSA